MQKGIESLIVSLLKVKDEKAMSLLYEHYSEVLYGVSFQIIKNDAAAEDALQESFVKIWKHSAQYDTSKAKLFTWMLKITRNTAIDHYRKIQKKRPKEIQIDSESVHIKDVSYNTDHIDVEEKMGLLATKNKEVLEALFFYGMTQREVSDFLNIPLGTVKSRLRIGLKTLAEVYQVKKN